MSLGDIFEVFVLVQKSAVRQSVSISAVVVALVNYYEESFFFGQMQFQGSL